MKNTGTKSSNIAETLRRQIVSGQYPEGERICSVRGIAREFSVSPRTAAKAIQLLIREGVLRSEARRGLFVDHPVRKKALIGYAGYLPLPHSEHPLRDRGISSLFDVLLDSGCETSVITFRDLSHPNIGAGRLRALDGLLLNAAFLDSGSEKLLFQYTKKLVIFGARYVIENFSGSQVIPDLFPALEKFHACFPFTYYRKILIVKPPHRNAESTCHQLSLYLKRLGMEDRIELLTFPGQGNYSAELAAYQHFEGKSQTELKGTLVIPLSDYCSAGIYAAGKKNGWFPEMLSIDNLEETQPQLVADKPYMTSIDMQFVQCHKTAAELLLKMVRENDPQNYLVRIPADIVFRESVHPQK